MPGRFVKKQPVALNPTVQGEQQRESHKIRHFAEHLDFFFLGWRLTKSLTDLSEVVAL